MVSLGENGGKMAFFKIKKFRGIVHGVYEEGYTVSRGGGGYK